jgi:hypothetical protein
MLPSSLACALALQDIRGNGMLPESMAENLISHSATPAPSEKFFRLLNVRYWMAAPDAAPAAKAWRRAGVSDNRMALFEPVNAGTPVWVAKSAILFPNRDDVVAKMNQASFDPAGPVLIDPKMDNPFDSTLDAGGIKPWSHRTASRWGADEAHLLQDDPQQIEVGIDYHGGGWLVLAERFYPGWQAQVRVERVDRHGLSKEPLLDAPIVRAFGCLRCIQLPPRAVAVKFVYDPPGWRAGYFGSAAAILAILLLFGLTLLTRSMDGKVSDE